MDSRVIDSIVESLVSGHMGIDDFMQAVEADIEAREASAAKTSASVAHREVA
jgi:hypothetical protein